MADLHLLGKVSKEERPFFDDKYYFYIERIDEGGEENSVVFHKGANMLEHVMFLWELIDSERRRLYKDLRQDVIEQDSNELESGGYLVTVEQIKTILDLVDALDKKLEKFLGTDRKVLPEYVEFISRIAPSQTFDDGTFNYNGLKDEISDIKMMKHFLNQAIELNYPLAIG